MKKIIISLILLTSISQAWTFSKNKTGALTGYSTPISQDIYKQLNIDPSNSKQRLKSPNVTTDLFSAPQSNFGYNSNGVLKEFGNSGVGAKTGVTIIYD